MRACPGLVCILLLAACGNDRSTLGTDGGSGGGGGGDGGDHVDAAMPPVDSNPLSGLPTGAAQWNAVCAKHYGDMISAKFCAGTTPPVLSSLADLEALLGLTVKPNPNADPDPDTNVLATLTSESTGLGLRSVNPITPRAFLMTPSLLGAPNDTYQVLSFSRGEPFVEMVANDPVAQTLRFYLLRFHHACEATGCTHADLQTPTIESDWTCYSLYDDQAIANTTLDCLNCHQPQGPGTKKILRMQELASPWEHWFYPEQPDTLQIFQAFQAAHPSEDYAGIPFQNLFTTRPEWMMQLLENNGFSRQPNAFDTSTIDDELATSGTSPTWNRIYGKALAGLEIPVPYYGNPADRTKLQAMIEAYRQTMDGTLPPAQMPDVSDTMMDSALSDLSIRPKPGLDGRGILVQMCQMCHNSRLDQTLSRARFNVQQLDQLPRIEKDLAIWRLQLPPADKHAMPPVRFHELSAAERQLAIDELRK
jgi:hypothetical protein